MYDKYMSCYIDKLRKLSVRTSSNSRNVVCSDGFGSETDFALSVSFHPEKSNSHVLSKLFKFEFVIEHSRLENGDSHISF